jgi:hypothetical protein
MAAGLGFKTFTTGEVLTAGDVNGYLMQGINVFTNATARDAAITAPAEGQFAFTKDNNSLWYYDGAAWVASGATGDIEGVTAGVGISGGGTSGTVTVTNSMATAIDAKGDLVPGTGADTFSRLAVGANDTVLTADSSTATGLKWATPAGGMTLIARTSFSNVASQAFDSVFTSSYFNYLVVIDDIFAATSSDDLQLQLRYAGPTTQTASYYGSAFSVPFSGSAAITASNNASQMTISAVTGSSTTTASGHFFVNNVGNSSVIPNFRGQYTDSDANQISFGGQINVARIYTGFLLKSSSTNITGNVSIYGLAK